MQSSDTSYPTPAYHSLDEIRLRKAQLLTDITKDGNKIQGIWDSIFHQPKDKALPTKRFSGLMTTGAGILDGLILGWKLYRKFKGKDNTPAFSLFKRKGKKKK